MYDIFALPASGADFFWGLLAVILIDIVLAGDNAVVIALAVKTLPPKEKRLGIFFGAGFAVLLRIVLTLFAAKLMEFKGIQIVGGALILWIAVKLLVEDDPHEELHHVPATLLQAIWIIVIADVTMSTDNVLALAGASKGNAFLLLFGLALSIPLVVGASSLLSGLMERYPLIITLGAALLGKVGVEMLITDKLTAGYIVFPQYIKYAFEALGALGVVLTAKFYLAYLKRRREAALDEPISEEQPGSRPPFKRPEVLSRD
jgi:YjbE family integral membrane protein